MSSPASEAERRRRVRQHREVGRSHEALDAGDDEIRDADVGNLDRQVIRRSLADGSEGEVVLETDGDRRAGRLDEGKYATAEGRGPQLALVEHQVEHGRVAGSGCRRARSSSRRRRRSAARRSPFRRRGWWATRSRRGRCALNGRSSGGEMSVHVVAASVVRKTCPPGKPLNPPSTA